MVVWLFLAVPWVSLQFVIVVFSDHTHLGLLFFVKLFGPKGMSFLALVTIMFHSEMPSQIENRIMARVYVRGITCSTRGTNLRHSMDVANA